MLTHIKLNLNRIYLRTVDTSYGEAILEYQIENRDFLKPFEAPKDERFYTKSYQKALIKQENQALKDLSGFDFWIFHNESNKIIGKIVVFSIIQGNFSMAMIGYKLHKDYVNQGYMTEAVNGVVSFMFNDLEIHRLEINILTDNLPSIAVARKTGFKQEGVAEKFAFINGKWRDHVRYGKINPNFKD